MNPKTLDLVQKMIDEGDFNAFDTSYSSSEVKEATRIAEKVKETHPKLWGANPSKPTKASILDTAKAAVADRGLNYGSPEDNFQRIARLWRAHLMNRYAPDGTSSKHLIPAIDAYDVAQMMALMKIARLENDPTHMDSWIDIAGYAACGGEIAGQAKKDA